MAETQASYESQEYWEKKKYEVEIDKIKEFDKILNRLNKNTIGEFYKTFENTLTTEQRERLMKEWAFLNH